MTPRKLGQALLGFCWALGLGGIGQKRPKPRRGRGKRFSFIFFLEILK
jgi:hypothetical protein